MNIRENLPSGVYLRAAVLAAADSQSSEIIVKYLSQAQAAGSKLSGSELPNGSIRAYLAKTPNKSLDTILNRIASQAMKIDKPSSELRALAGLLAMDGQTARSERFLKAATDGPVSSTKR